MIKREKTPVVIAVRDRVVGRSRDYTRDKLSPKMFIHETIGARKDAHIFCAEVLTPSENSVKLVKYQNPVQWRLLAFFAFLIQNGKFGSNCQDKGLAILVMFSC